MKKFVYSLSFEDRKGHRGFKIIFQHLAIYNDENLPNGIRNLPKSVEHIPKQILTKLSKTLPKWRNFTKSGLTGDGQQLLA